MARAGSRSVPATPAPRSDYASVITGMRLSSSLRAGFLTVVILAATSSVRAQEPEAQPSASESSANESKGMPPRASPADYQAHAQAGSLTIAAEFVGHSVPTPEATYDSEDFVVVEAGLFGAPDARAKLSIGDFSLRINGKKVAFPSLPYAMSFRSLKDPEWEPPSKDSKSKTSIGTGGGGGDDSTPAPVHMPIELKRAMQQHVQKAAMPEGDRALPAAGLLFFEYRGKTQGIRSLELVYSGPAGNAVLALQP